MAAYFRGNKMSLVTVYDTDGQPHQKEPVDVKECIAVLGWTMEPKQVEAVVAEPDAPKQFSDSKNRDGKR